ncbi:MAG: 1-phosphofructokinase family hexose kinase [Kiritimatiellia bacterium]
MRKYQVLCAGAYPALQRTLYLAKFFPGRVNRCGRVDLDVAGKAVNAARVAKRLGLRPVLSGFSGGSSGDEIERLLQQQGLDYSGFWRVAAAVRICQTILPEDGAPFTELVEEGPVLPDEDWGALSRYCCRCLEKMGDAAVILAGTMPAHASRSFYLDVMQAAKGPVLLDTSGPMLLDCVRARPDVVKINADELGATFGGDASDPRVLIDMSRRLLVAGAGVVGITQGAGDAYLVTPDAVWRFAIPTVAVVSPLGSGDSVNAGMIAGLLEGRSLVEAFGFGLAAGSANVETAKPGVLERRRVEVLYDALRAVQVQ